MEGASKSLKERVVFPWISLGQHRLLLQFPNLTPYPPSRTLTTSLLLCGCPSGLLPAKCLLTRSSQQHETGLRIVWPALHC